MKSISHLLRDERGQGAMEPILVLVVIVGLAWIVKDQLVPSIAANVTDFQQSLDSFQAAGSAVKQRSVVRRLATLGE